MRREALVFGCGDGETECAVEGGEEVEDGDGLSVGRGDGDRPGELVCDEVDEGVGRGEGGEGELMRKEWAAGGRCGGDEGGVGVEVVLERRDEVRCEERGDFKVECLCVLLENGNERRCWGADAWFGLEDVWLDEGRGRRVGQGGEREFGKGGRRGGWSRIDDVGLCEMDAFGNGGHCGGWRGNVDGESV